MTTVFIAKYAIIALLFFWIVSGAGERSQGLTFLSIPPVIFLFYQCIFARRHLIPIVIFNLRQSCPYLIWCVVAFWIGMFHRAPGEPGALALIDALFFVLIGLAFIFPYEREYVCRLDRCLAIMTLIGVLLGIYGITAGWASTTNFSRLDIGVGRIGIAGYMRTFSIYLLLKYASSVNLMAFIGMIGMATNAYVSMITGARNGVLTFLISLLFAAFLIYRTQGKGRRKALSVGIPLVIIVIGFFAYQVITRSPVASLFIARMEIWFGIRGSVQQSGFANDPRVLELISAKSYLLSPKILFGYGMGASWWDSLGVFGNVPWRFEIHINWFHYLFKLGAIGVCLYLSTLWKKIKTSGYNNLAYIFFIILWLYSNSTYGFKLPSPTTLIFFYILYNPIMFWTPIAAVKKGRIRQHISFNKYAAKKPSTSV